MTNLEKLARMPVFAAIATRGSGLPVQQGGLNYLQWLIGQGLAGGKTPEEACTAADKVLNILDAVYTEHIEGKKDEPT